jgi:hypothetical protein
VKAGFNVYLGLITVSVGTAHYSIYTAKLFVYSVRSVNTGNETVSESGSVCGHWIGARWEESER